MSTRTSWIALIVIFLMTLVIYWQGITGIFLLDDYGVLPRVSNYAHLEPWRHFLLFMLEGDTGPTGRPISLATFFLNSQTWPASPWAFKVTNIFIHLINGLLIFFLLKKLLQTICLKQSYSNGIVIIVTGYWLLHPFQITSVLYIVQRMTELSAFFILLGLLAYTYGRTLVLNKPDYRSYILLTFGVSVSGILAILSKENGVLLLGYLLTIEFFLFRPSTINTPKKFNLWLMIIIILPFASLMLYVLTGSLSENAYSYRDFTLAERLLTQPRILFDYLNNILMPGLQTPTPFHDDYVVSTGLLQPLTTLFSVLGILLLIVVALSFRKKHPILSFAIAWFFCGHLLESTVIPLELYFEHRNYLPMLGPLLALTYYGVLVINQQTRLRKPLLILAILYTLMLMGSTLMFTHLWGKPVKLIVGWAQEHPQSIRAIETLEALEVEMGFKVHDETLKASMKNLYKPTSEGTYSSYVLFRELKFACSQGVLSNKKLGNALKKLQSSHFETSLANTFLSFFNDWLKGDCDTITSKTMLTFIQSFQTIKQLQIGQTHHITEHALSRLWEKERNLDKTLFHLMKAYQLKPKLSGLLLQASHLTSAGHHEKALNVINNTSLLKNSLRKQLILKLRQPEVDMLIARINKNIKQEKINATGN